jgi:hypothetical protein
MFGQSAPRRRRRRRLTPPVLFLLPPRARPQLNASIDEVAATLKAKDAAEAAPQS